MNDRTSRSTRTFPTTRPTECRGKATESSGAATFWRETSSQTRGRVAEAMVTTVGAEGVLDTGASRTVIGDKRVKQLLQGLSKECRDNARKVASDVTFRFGNSGTLSSKHAMLLPASDSSWVRVEVIPGNTPLLISHRLLRDLDAVIHVRDSFVQVGERRVRTCFDDKGLTIIDIAELLHVPHSRVFLSESQHHPRETSQPQQQHTEHDKPTRQKRR